MLKNDLHALRHVGTHGPCVRARRMKHKCTIVRTDARAVRPYMPLVNSSSYHFANHKVQSSKFNIQSQGPYLHSNGLQSQPYYAVITAILACNMADIVL